MRQRPSPPWWALRPPRRGPQGIAATILPKWTRSLPIGGKGSRPGGKIRGAALPTAEEWAEQVDYVIKTVGADHVALGLDLVAGRSAVPPAPSGYPDLLAQLRRITSEDNVRKIAGENWLRVLAAAKVG